jgi:adenine-specific DNA-methyltransferase
MTNNDITVQAQEFDSKDIENIKNNGVVFTPLFVVKQIIKNSNPKITDKICEPSVGKGIFIFTLIEYFIEKQHNINDIANFISNNLYCFDTNPYFIEDIKEKIIIYFKNNNYVGNLNLDNIKCADYLNSVGKYDIVIGNPPYVKIHNIDKDVLDKLKLKLETLSEGNIDLYYAFVEKALNDADKVNFIIPNTFIKSKSGKILRIKLKNRLTSIQDFKTEKVWKNISTYTCIISCLKNSNSFTYNGNLIDVRNLNDDVWIFDELSGDNQLNDLINYSGIGIQTSADKYYITNKFDSNFAYINGCKIELGICKKIIKATKSKSFTDFKYVIYPYDKDGLPLNEEYIQTNFVYAWNYLVSIKKQLLERNLNHNFWYAYGRNQGLIRNKIGTQIILPNIFLKSKNIHYIEIPSDEEVLVQNGILVDTKNLTELKNKIQSNEFLSYLEKTNKNLPDKQGSTDVWLTINANNLKNYKY